MNRLASILTINSIVFLCALTGNAQTAPKVASTGGISPHETFSSVIAGNRVTIIYGRPFSKDPKGDDIRKIWGTLVPWAKVWRAGSDEATLLITQKPIKMGDLTIPAGAHTLFMMPMEKDASKLIVNNQIGQWGLQYDEKQDLGRVDLTREYLSPQIDQFTMSIDKANGGGVLHLKWETSQYSIPFSNAN